MDFCYAYDSFSEDVESEQIGYCDTCINKKYGKCKYGIKLENTGSQSLLDTIETSAYQTVN